MRSRRLCGSCRRPRAAGWRDARLRGVAPEGDACWAAADSGNTCVACGGAGYRGRLALVEVSEGRSGTWRDDVRLLCSGFDPAHGTYNLMVSRVLAVSAAATTLALVCGIGALVLMGRRRAA